MASQKQNMTAILYDKRGRVLSVGKNSYTKSHTAMWRLGVEHGEPHKIFKHAELDAILRCDDISKVHKISVFRYNRQGKPMMAKPCKLCQSLIDKVGIKVVEYTTGGEE